MINSGRSGSGQSRALVDIHAHLLPGIDDGPSDLDGALALARTAVEAGVRTLAATPHLRADFPAVDVYEIAARCEAVRQQVSQEGIALRVVSGAEISLAWALGASAEQLRLASYCQRGTDLLVETPSSGLFGVEAMLWELRLKGFRITLAHPERSGDSDNTRSALQRLVDQGVLLQVNAAALLRGRRTPAGQLAEWLCTQGLSHVLASDAHRASSWRPVTILADAVDELVPLVGRARALWMVVAVPSAIVDGRTLPTAPDVKSKRFLPRW